MSNDINGVTVTFEPNMREEEAAVLIAAIKQLRGVIRIDVHPAEIMHSFDVMQAKYELTKKLWEVLK